MTEGNGAQGEQMPSGVSGLFDGLEIQEYLMICDAFREGRDFENEKLQGLKNLIKQRYSELKSNNSFNESSMKARLELFDLMIKFDVERRVTEKIEEINEIVSERFCRKCSRIKDNCVLNHEDCEVLQILRIIDKEFGVSQEGKK